MGMQPITASSIKVAIGATWFDLEDDEQHFHLDSRSHGNVGAEVPGEADKTEGLRLLKLLEKAFPKTNYHAPKFEVVDEWVTITITKAPLTAKEKKERLFRQRIKKSYRELAEFFSARPFFQQHVDAKKVRCSFSCHLQESYTSKNSFTISIAAVFGSVPPGQDWPGSYEFPDADAAEKALRSLLADKSLPSLDWKLEVVPAQERRNFSNKLIEIAGKVTFSFKATHPPA